MRFHTKLSCPRGAEPGRVGVFACSARDGSRRQQRPESHEGMGVPVARSGLRRAGGRPDRSGAESAGQRRGRREPGQRRQPAGERHRTDGSAALPRQQGAASLPWGRAARRGHRMVPEEPPSPSPRAPPRVRPSNSVAPPRPLVPSRGPRSGPSGSRSPRGPGAEPARSLPEGRPRPTLRAFRAVTRLRAELRNKSGGGAAFPSLGTRGSCRENPHGEGNCWGERGRPAPP